MALTESVQLDIREAERQIATLENQLQDLSSPIDVPVEIGDIDTAQFDRIAESLGVSSDEARELTEQVRGSVATASDLDRDLRDVAESMGLSSTEAAAFSREMRGAVPPAQDVAASSREAASASDDLAAGWTRIRPLIAAAAAAFGVRAVVGAGFDRFTTIEDATTALTIQLQDAGAAAEVLAETLEVVRGTPFNLDQFAQATSQLIAFGVEASNIPPILTAIGEAAATRGAEAPQFVDRLVELFGQITTTGRITGQEIRRFSQTGVNALAILANSFGVTTEEMRDMVSDGVVPAEQAIAALTTGIIEGTEGAAGSTVALGGTMEGLRDTLTGARGGLGAAVARFGEALVDAASPAILAWLQAATGGFDELGEAIRGTADDADTARNSFVDFIADLPRGFGAVADIGTGLGGAFLSLIDVAAELVLLDPAAAVDAFEASLVRLDDTSANIAIRIIEQDVIDALRGGVAPIDAFANALVRLDEKQTLTAESMARFASITGVSEAELLTVLGTFREFDDAFDPETIELFTRVWRDLVESTFDIGPNFERAGRGAREVSDALLSEAQALEIVGSAADEAGTSISDYLASQTEIPPNVAAAAAALSDSTLAYLAQVEAINEAGAALDQLPQRFSAAADAFRDAEGEIVQSAAEFVENFAQQLEDTRNFEANLVRLAAAGFGALADELQRGGPELAPLVTQFLDDPRLAAEANRLAQGVGDETAQGLITALADELAAADFSTETVQSLLTIANAADDPAIQAAIAQLVESLRFDIPFGFVFNPSSAAAPFLEANVGQGSPGGGATTVNNVTNNFTTPPQPSTDTQRIQQSIGALID